MTRKLLKPYVYINDQRDNTANIYSLKKDFETFYNNEKYAHPEWETEYFNWKIKIDNGEKLRDNSEAAPYRGGALSTDVVKKAYFYKKYLQDQLKEYVNLKSKVDPNFAEELENLALNHLATYKERINKKYDEARRQAEYWATKANKYENMQKWSDERLKDKLKSKYYKALPYSADLLTNEEIKLFTKRTFEELSKSKTGRHLGYKKEIKFLEDPAQRHDYEIYIDQAKNPRVSNEHDRNTKITRINYSSANLACKNPIFVSTSPLEIQYEMFNNYPQVQGRIKIDDVDYALIRDGLFNIKSSWIHENAHKYQNEYINDETIKNERTNYKRWVNEDNFIKHDCDKHPDNRIQSLFASNGCNDAVSERSDITNYVMPTEGLYEAEQNEPRRYGYTRLYKGFPKYLTFAEERDKVISSSDDFLNEDYPDYKSIKKNIHENWNKYFKLLPQYPADKLWNDKNVDYTLLPLEKLYNHKKDKFKEFFETKQTEDAANEKLFSYNIIQLQNAREKNKKKRLPDLDQYIDKGVAKENDYTISQRTNTPPPSRS